MDCIPEFQGEYRWLSNFWAVDIEYLGLKFDSVEAAYQAAKCVDSSEMIMFVGIEPGEAKRMGRKIRMRPDWDDVKLRIMEGLLIKKFQDPQMRAQLLATDDAEIIESNSWHDTFWGVCQGKGENHLGRILMDIRRRIRNGQL